MQEIRPFVPVGFKFRPSDEELIEFYLYKKVSGIHIPYVDYIVKECNLYGDEPGNIWESYGGPLLNEDEDLYFFTKLTKKSPNSSRINRIVGLGPGAWQGEDAPNEIISRKSHRLIGSKKRFRYENQRSEDNGCWIMHEYTLDQSLLGQNQSINYVICRIRKNQPTRKNKKSGLAKKRKPQDYKKSNQSVEPERFFTQQENKKVVWNSDKMVEQYFQIIEAGEIGYSSVAGAGQYEIPMVRTAPDETIQTSITVQSAEPERMLTQQENQQQQMCVNNVECPSVAEQHEAPVAMPDQIVILQQEECSDSDFLIELELTDEDFCLSSEALTEKDWVTVQSVQEMMCKLPKFMSEEYVFVPSDNGESAGSTSSCVDMMIMMSEQSLSDHRGEGNLQRSERVADVPMAFPDRTMVIEIPQHQLVSEENAAGQIASVDCATMQSTNELPQLHELPQLPSEENVNPQIVSENCGTNSSSVCLSLDDCQPFHPLSLVREN